MTVSSSEYSLLLLLLLFVCNGKVSKKHHPSRFYLMTPFAKSLEDDTERIFPLRR